MKRSGRNSSASSPQYTGLRCMPHMCTVNPQPFLNITPDAGIKTKLNCYLYANPNDMLYFLLSTRFVAILVWFTHFYYQYRMFTNVIGILLFLCLNHALCVQRALANIDQLDRSQTQWYNIERFWRRFSPSELGYQRFSCFLAPEGH